MDFAKVNNFKFFEIIITFLISMQLQSIKFKLKIKKLNVKSNEC